MFKEQQRASGLEGVGERERRLGGGGMCEGWEGPRVPGRPFYGLWLLL